MGGSGTGEAVPLLSRSELVCHGVPRAPLQSLAECAAVKRDFSARACSGGLAPAARASQGCGQSGTILVCPRMVPGNLQALGQSWAKQSGTVVLLSAVVKVSATQDPHAFSRCFMMIRYPAGRTQQRKYTCTHMVLVVERARNTVKGERSRRAGFEKKSAETVHCQLQEGRSTPFFAEQEMTLSPPPGKCPRGRKSYLQTQGVEAEGGICTTHRSRISSSVSQGRQAPAVTCRPSSGAWSSLQSSSHGNTVRRLLCHLSPSQLETLKA